MTCRIHGFRGWLALPCLLLQAVGAEWRGWWVDAFHPGIKSPTEVAQLVSHARAAHINALFVQVRKRGDAYYDSALEPKAPEISPPSFDPLAELLRLAHDTSGGQPRLDVHAWIVAYNIWNSASRQPSQPNHPYRLHPDWLTESVGGNRWDGSNYAFDPAHPQVQDHTVAVALDLVTRYDVDGLHLDYIRYNGSSWGYHPVAVRRFQRQYGRTTRPAATDAQWSQFRRDQVTALVRRIHLSAVRMKPQLRISAATITFAPGITATSQWTTSAAYREVFQDWRAWLEEGLLDLNAPMAYFRQGANGADWTAWSTFAKNHRYGRHLALGVATYLNTPTDSVRQLRSTRLPTESGGTADGMALYSYASPASDGTTFDPFREGLRSGFPGDTEPPLFEAPDRVPPMPWKDQPVEGALLGGLRGADGARVVLSGPGVRMLRADANGWFGALRVPPGEVRLTAEALGAVWMGTVRIEAGRVAEPTLWRVDGDDDGDGVTNEEELLWGTDPGAVEGEEAILIEPMLGGLQMRFPGGPAGREFVVWYRRDLGVESDWEEIFRTVTSADEAPPVVDLSPWWAPVSGGFYRVEIRWAAGGE